ncbi:MAG: hypothetical protein ACLR76_07385 [Alistipes sp.]
MIKSEIAFVRSLSSKKERAASGLFVAEGEKLVGEMLASEFRVRKIFRCGEEDRSEAGSVDTERVSPKEMKRISALKTPTPVLALIELPRYRLSAGTGTDDLALALDGVRTPAIWERSSGWPTGSAFATSSARKTPPTVSGRKPFRLR